MKDIVIAGLICVAGLINFIPIAGVISRARLEKLYGLSINDPNLEILMRHRAVMFGMLGGFMVYAAFHPVYHLWAIGAGLLSMTSFIALAYSVGGYTAHIQKIDKADIIGIVCLILAGGLML